MLGSGKKVTSKQRVSSQNDRLYHPPLGKKIPYFVQRVVTNLLQSKCVSPPALLKLPPKHRWIVFLPYNKTIVVLLLVEPRKCGFTVINVSADVSNPIQLVFPTLNPTAPHTTFEAQSFLLGRICLPAKQLWIQGETVLVSPEGYFAHVVPLHDGLNTFYLETDTNHTHTCQILQAVPPLTTINQSVFYKEASLTLQGSTDSIIGITPTPAVYQWGDTVAVQCLTLGETDVTSVHAHLTDARGRSVTQAKLLPKTLTEPPNTRYHWDNRTAVFAQLHQTTPAIPKTVGWFEGYIQLPPFWMAGNALTPQGGMPLYLELFATGNGTSISGERWKPAGIAIEVWNQPKLAFTTTPTACIRSCPSTTGARLTELPSQTGLSIDGQQGDWLRVKRANQQVGYVHNADASAPEPGLLLPIALKTMSLQQTETDTWQLSLPLSRKTPYFITTSAHQSHLHLVLDSVEHHCDFIHFQQNPLIEPPSAIPLSINVTATGIQSPQTTVSIQLPKRYCGYQTRWDETGLHLTVRRLPITKTACTIIIDAGHGGEELGAIGLDGTPEKNWNLQLATLLAKQLQLAGFTNTLLTRTMDTALTLAQRQTIVEQNNAHISISVHANALPEGRNPLVHQGVSAYYYQPPAKKLATQLLQYISKTAQRPVDGLFFDNLALTRPSHCLAVLVEYGYFIHPTEFACLQKEATQQQLVAGTIAGIETLF